MKNMQKAIKISLQHVIKLPNANCKTIFKNFEKCFLRPKISIKHLFIKKYVCNPDAK